MKRIESTQGQRFKNIDQELAQLSAISGTDLYAVNTVGDGESNIVFKVNNHPGVVVKVPYKEIIKQFREESARLKGGADNSLELELALEHRTKIKKEQLAKLKSALTTAGLPKGIVPRSHFLWGTIPVNQTLINQTRSSRSHQPIDITEPGTIIRTILEIQTALPEAALNEEMSVDLRFDYVESFPSVTPALYQDFNRVLVDGDGDLLTTPVYREKIRAIALGYLHLEHQVRPDSDWKRILDMIDPHSKSQRNKQVMALFSEFVSASIALAKEGELLDFGGSNNVILYSENDQWKLIIPDPFAGCQLFYQANLIANNLHLTSITDSKSALGLFNPLNTIRLVNALAIVLELPDRIRLANPIAPYSEEILAYVREKRFPKTKPTSAVTQPANQPATLS